MLVYKEFTLSEFPFWGPAESKTKVFTPNEWSIIESKLREYTLSEVLDEVELNDFFSYNEDVIAQWLGYSNYDDLLERD